MSLKQFQSKLNECPLENLGSLEMGDLIPARSGSFVFFFKKNSNGILGKNNHIKRASNVFESNYDSNLD